MALFVPSQRPKETTARDLTPQVVPWSDVAKQMSELKTDVVCVALGVVGLRSVNDGFSRSTGDVVLAEIGRRLESVPQGPTIVSRIGGSRFLLVTGSTGDDDGLLSALVGAVTQPVETPLGLAAIGCAAGAVSGPCRSPLLLIDQADRNLDTALREGAGTIAWHSPGERDGGQGRARLAAPLLAGLTAGSISAEFHPLVDADTGEIVEYKAAACWNDENGTLRSAHEFVDVASDLGVISDVGWIVIRAAIDLCVDLNKDGREPPIRVAVSVTARELCKGGFAARIGDMIAVADVRPGSLHLELSGGVVPQYVQRLSDSIALLRKIGVGIRVGEVVTGVGNPLGTPAENDTQDDATSQAAPAGGDAFPAPGGEPAPAAAATSSDQPRRGPEGPPRLLTLVGGQ
jgi:predicted signal transduction protein with EAL and GGDEF domain